MQTTLSEEFLSSVCGPPVAANTAVSKDVGIYLQSLEPSYAVKASFKKSWAPAHGLAVTHTHVFAAQDQKAHVHVYSRQRGNQEALVAFPERIRCIALVHNVLVLGTVDGRLMLWETCTGRLISTPPCHVQAVSCLAVTPYHVLSASDDSNIHVWPLSGLLELDCPTEHKPELTLSHHRGAINSLMVSQSTTQEASICVSASRDKTCIIWDYRSGHVLRTLLFSTVPLCAALDPCTRALFVGGEDNGIYFVELFGDKPLLGPDSAEPASIVVQVGSPLGFTDSDFGQPSCLAVNYDASVILTGHSKGRIVRWSLADTGHPVELANLNASVTNLVFLPILARDTLIQPDAIVKPNQTTSRCSLSGRIRRDHNQQSRLVQMLYTPGFSATTIHEALLSMSAPALKHGSDDDHSEYGTDWAEILGKLKRLQGDALAW